MKAHVDPRAVRVIEEVIADMERLDLNPTDVVEALAWLLVECCGLSPATAAMLAREHVPMVAVH